MRRFRFASLALSAALALAGCTGSSEPPKLEGALLNPPVYAPSKLVDSGSYFTGDTGLTHHGMVFKLETSDPFDKVDAFYQAKLPGAQASADNTADRKNYLYFPPGAGPGEDIAVTIEKADGKTKFSIYDVVQRGKRGDD